MTKREFLRLLDDDFKIACAKPPPSRADLALLERRLGRSLPKAYRDFLLRWGGVGIEVKEEAWPRPGPHTVAPFWTFCFGWDLLGIGKRIPAWLNLAKVARQLHRDYPQTRDLLPF